MTEGTRIRQGTRAWFEMAGELMSAAASRAGSADHEDVSLVERYTDGAGLADGFVQGLRFEIVDGKASFRVGVGQDERGDVTVELTAAAARTLNTLHSTDPEYQATRERLLGSGEMRVTGDPKRLGDWLDDVHDPIVDRTA